MSDRRFALLAENDDFQGLDIDILRQLQVRSGGCAHLKRVARGRALQTDADRSRWIYDDKNGSHRGAGAFIDYPQPFYYQYRPAFYGKPPPWPALGRYEICEAAR